MEDYWTEHFDPHLAFELTDGGGPIVALCHNPDAAPSVAHHGADWVLAGHTHGTGRKDTKLGDLVLPTNHKRFSAGEYDLGDGKALYVNRGLGYGRRIRCNGRPEITLFTLTER